MKRFFTALLTIVLATALVFAVMLTVFEIKHPKHDTPSYPLPQKGYVYYPVESLPSCFETYLGYTPKMSFDKANGIATFQLAGGYTISATVNQFAENMWALEVPANSDSIFRKYSAYSYKCFDYTTEQRFLNERNAGIFYDIPTAQQCFQEITGRNRTLVHTMNLGIFEYYLATSDDDAKITMKNEGRDYALEGDGEFLVSGRLLSQLIYDWEMANQHVDVHQISLGNII